MRLPDSETGQIPTVIFGTVNGVIGVIASLPQEHIPESPSRELCILTTLARNDPPAIEESLLRIKSVRETELLSYSDDSRKKSCPSAEEALKHLLWLVDFEAVFEAALGRYYLNLAATVVLNPQCSSSSNHKPQEIPACMTNTYEWAPEPEGITDVERSPQGSVTELLVKWKGLPEFESTWESVVTMMEQFPDFNLEDKVSSLPGGIDRLRVPMVFMRKKTMSKGRRARVWKKKNGTESG